MPANQEPIITLEAPAASASATSRGWRTPPSAQTCLPSSRAAAAHSSTAENCGRPTPVIIRVVHIAPGPDADLDDVGAGVDQVADALGGDHVAGRRPAPAGRAPRTAPQRLDHPLLVAVRGVDDEQSTPGVEQLARPWPATSPLMPTAAATRSRPSASTAGLVERGAQRARAGQDADQPAVGVDDRGEPAPGRVEPVEGRPRVDVAPAA